MAVTTTMTQANGQFKEVYDKVKDARVSAVRVLDYSKFKANKRLGENYVDQVWLSSEEGFSYQTSTSSMLALNSSIAATSDKLEISGGEIALRSRVAAKPLFAAAKAGTQAFGNLYARLIANMRQSHKKRLEFNAIYGGISIATSESISGTSTTRDIVISVATWAPWIWAGSVNRWLDGYSTTTKLNDSATDGTEAIVVTDVTHSTRTIGVSGESTDLTACDTPGDAGTLELYLYGSYGKERTGYYSAAGNTGTYASIDATAFDLWEGNSYAVGSTQLTWKKLGEALELAAGKGADEDLVGFISIPTWSNFNRDLMALRHLDAGYEVGETHVGHRSIKFHGITGMVELVPTGCMHGGKAMLLPKSEMQHVGTTEPTFKYNTDEGPERFLREVEDAMAIELRSYSDEAPLLSCPSKAVAISGIVN